MRHFFGFFLGLLLAPVILVVSGWALPRVIAMANSSGAFFGGSGLTTIGVLSALGLLVALVLVPPRLTPLVPGIAGLSLVGCTTAHLLRPWLIDLIPDAARVPGLSGTATLLELGLFLPLALTMIVPMFWPSRWQSYRPRGAHAFTDDDYDDEEDGFSDLHDDRREAT